MLMILNCHFGLISSPLTQTRMNHPCPGPCQKLCFAVPIATPTPNTAVKLKATCACPYGEKLGENSFQSNKMFCFGFVMSYVLFVHKNCEFPKCYNLPGLEN